MLEVGTWIGSTDAQLPHLLQPHHFRVDVVADVGARLDHKVDDLELVEERGARRNLGLGFSV